MIAITGATGLLGGHILSKFANEGVNVVALYRPGNDALLPASITKRPADILDPVSLREAFEGASTVVHAAALVSFNPRRRKKIREVNVEGTRHVINTCLQLGIKNLIHISSVSALGRKAGELVTEDSKWIDGLSSDYAESKYLAELEVFRGAEEGLTVSIVNPSLILSASQPARSSAALFDYVWNESPFYTGGTLNYVDARDVADVVFQLYKNPQSGEKFILSAGSISYKDFFTSLSLHFKKRAPTIKISSGLSYWAGLADEVRGLLFNREPLVTRQSARMASQSFRYDNKKVHLVMGMRFRSLEETLQWCSDDYLRNVKTNK